MIEIGEDMSSTFQKLEAANHNFERLAAELNRIYERAQEEALALLQSRPQEQVNSPVREWMNPTQLAEYWQLYNDKYEPTTAGILKWGEATHRPVPVTSCVHGRSVAIQSR